MTRHVSRQLARYVDGQLTAADAHAVEAHLAGCQRCRAEHDDIRFAAGLVKRLAVVAPPASVWTAINDGLVDPRAPAPRHLWFLAPRLAAAALLVLVTIATAYWLANRPAAAQPWEVTRLGDVAVRARMAEGDLVETDGASRARITVGDIGTVDVEPQTRVRLGAVLPDAYRIALTRGTISARISAPPRLFFVETPASTVVDLGCAYTVNIDEGGNGTLRVTEGWASLEWKGRESLVPAGALCPIDRTVGPGTPYFEGATLALRDALLAFDFTSGGSAVVTTILAESRVRDTLTLWHLLSRVDAADRPRVYDRIAELAPPPDTVSREKALQLDADTLKHWREELAWKW